MHPKPGGILLLLLALLTHNGLSLFEARAEDLPYPHLNNPADTNPENHSCGLIDRPAAVPISLNNPEQHGLIKRADPSMSTAAAPVAPMANDAVLPSDAPATPIPGTPDLGGLNTSIDTAYPTPYPEPNDFATDSVDTYGLPPAYESAQLSSLFAEESSYFDVVGSVLSAFPTEGDGVECTGVEDVEGQVVTVCGPTGDPGATGLGSENGVGEMGLGLGIWGGGGRGLWVGMGLGGVAGGMAFWL